MTTDKANAIYPLGEWHYRDAGWRGVLPLRPGTKLPLLAGYTGYDGRWPTDEEIAKLVDEVPAGCNLMAAGRVRPDRYRRRRLRRQDRRPDAHGGRDSLGATAAHVALNGSDR